MKDFTLNKLDRIEDFFPGLERYNINWKDIMLHYDMALLPSVRRGDQIFYTADSSSLAEALKEKGVKCASRDELGLTCPECSDIYFFSEELHGIFLYIFNPIVTNMLSTFLYDKISGRNVKVRNATFAWHDDKDKLVVAGFDEGSGDTFIKALERMPGIDTREND